ncbi:hypothetical protein ARMGADRAFT_1098448 [Armillaria gallica]|uniref:Nephrocystin 3-like N-terminal domain-containing protein n=1 Tax=Armillaria gallica TaxID=47427 RepID=A0A2H3CB47_ARMGA|nr:hypothetical protein ARMGADRAFT_1098448 [Armillaria gallica]
MPSLSDIGSVSLTHEMACCTRKCVKKTAQTPLKQGMKVVDRRPLVVQRSYPHAALSHETTIRGQMATDFLTRVECGPRLPTTATASGYACRLGVATSSTLPASQERRIQQHMGIKHMSIHVKPSFCLRVVLIQVFQLLQVFQSRFPYSRPFRLCIVSNLEAVGPAPAKLNLSTSMASSTSPPSISLDTTTSDLVTQLKSALAGIVADRQEFKRSCQEASIHEVHEAMVKLLKKIPKERTKSAKTLARYAGSLDKVAEMVAPIVNAAIADTFLLFDNVLPILQSLSSTELDNGAITRVFSAMIKFLVDAAKFLGRNRLNVLRIFDDSNLRAASAHLQSAIDTALKMVPAVIAIEQKKKDVLKLIYHVPYEADLEALRSARLSNTCLWALTHPVIARWMDSTTDHIWLHGAPGTGKSILAAFLIDSVLKQIRPPATNSSSPEIVLYFFCDSRSGSSMRRSSVAIAKSLLTQLVENPLLRLQDFSKFVEYVTKKALDFDFPVRALVDHLMVILKGFSKTWIIIDALDECHEEVVGPNGIIQMLRKPTGVNLKLACLSRKETSIEKQLNGWQSAEVGENYTTEDDIRRFASVKVGEVGSKDHYPGGRDELVAHIVQATGNMFLYIVLKVENLKYLTPEEMEMELNRSPEKLDDLYAEYLDRRMEQNRVSDHKTAIRALQWILHSRQSVTPTLLATALAVDGFSGMKPISDVGEGFKNVLGILVVFRKVNDEVQVTLVHETLKDFLVRSGDHNQETSLCVADQSRILVRPRDPSVSNQRSDSAIRKPIRDTTLYVLCDPMRLGQSHMRLFEACVAVMSSDKFLIPSQKYNDSFDRRRAELSRKERNGKLEGELCHGDQCGKAKRMRRLYELNTARVRRREEIQDIESRLDDLPNAIGPLQHVKQLLRQRRDELNEWERLGLQVEIDEVKSLQDLEVKDLLDYAFRNFSSHLGQVVQCYNGIHNQDLATVPSLLFLLDTYLHRIEHFASSVAANAILRVQSLPLHSNHSSHIATLASALRTIHLVVTDIRSLSLAFNSEWKPLTTPAGIPRVTYRYWRWTLFPRFSNMAANSRSILHEKIMASLNEVKPISEKKRLKILFGLLTQTVTGLRRCEAALYALDEEWMPIVGASNLIDASHHAAQIFVCYAVQHTCTHLPDAPRTRQDVFKDAVLLQPPCRSSMDQCAGSTRQLLMKHYLQPPPLALAIPFFVFFVAGAMNWILVWIPVLVLLSCSRGDLCDCRSYDPSTVHEIMHILTPSFIIGRFLFLDYRVAVPSALITSIILVYTSVLIYHIFRLCGKHHFWSAPYRISVLNWSVVFVLLWQGVVSALLQDISLLKVMNAFTAHILSYNIVTVAVDRTGDLHASTQLKQFAARFSNEAVSHNRAALSS